MKGDNPSLTPEEIIMRLFFLALKTRATLFFLSYLGYIIHVLFVQSFIVQNYLFIYSSSYLLPIQWYILCNTVLDGFSIWAIIPPPLYLDIYMAWIESALHSIFQLWLSRNQGQRLFSHSLNFNLLSKSFGIYGNYITVSPQNFGKSSTHQKSPFLEESILGNGLSVCASPHIHKNSKISKINKGTFMKFLT